MAAARIVIVGGGVVGSAVAYWLTADPEALGGREVVVVERDPTYRRSSSALSASGVRQQYSTAVNVEIGRFAVEFLRAAGERLAVGDDRPDLGLTEPGYLFLASGAGLDVLRANHEVQRAHGADAVLLGLDQLASRFPWLAVDDLAGASLGESGEGWFDGYALLRALRRKAVAQGARYVGGEVVGLDVAASGGAVAAAQLGDGTRLACDALVNAAGPWAAAVAAMAGVDLPVRARRRTVFVLDCPEPPTGRRPLVIDTSGVWFRPEGRHTIAGTPPPKGEDLDDLPLDEPEHDLFEEVVWPALAHRVPAFERLRAVSAWAGYYEYNTVDQNGIVGAHPEIPNLYLANGFSGHGLQQAPAVGRGIAELVLHGRYRTLDLSPLGYERLLRGEPLLERNVI